MDVQSKIPADVELDHQHLFGAEWFSAMTYFQQFSIDTHGLDANLRAVVDVAGVENKTSSEKERLFHPMIADSSEVRVAAARLANGLIEGDDFFDNMKHVQATVLLFANWNTLSEAARQKISEKYGMPLNEDYSLIPFNEIRTSESAFGCSAMETRMVESRKHSLIANRLVLKYYGTIAAITDRLTVFKDGNVLLPFFFYIPDSYFAEKAQDACDAQDGSIVELMRQRPLMLRIMRNSPVDALDDGVNNYDPEHMGYDFAGFRKKLTALIEKLSGEV